MPSHRSHRFIVHCACFSCVSSQQGGTGSASILLPGVLVPLDYQKEDTSRCMAMLHGRGEHRRFSALGLGTQDQGQQVQCL